VVEAADGLTMPADIVGDPPADDTTDDVAAKSDAEVAAAKARAAKVKAAKTKADKAKRDKAKKDKAKKDKAKKDKAKKDKAKKDVDSAAVLAKFKSVSSKYRAFKKSYGSRLEKEWADLATFAQYARNRPEKMKILDKRIDKFRARMRQAMK
jgi:membrane protein involved in colicin uptake